MVVSLVRAWGELAGVLVCLLGLRSTLDHE